MTVSAALLRELHRLHQQLGDLRSRLQRGPRQIQVADSNMVKAKAELEAAKESVKQARMTADQKELQLRERENRILDIKAKLNGCSTNREYQTFVEQIAADEQANSVLSDEILELFDKTNELQGRAEVIKIQNQKLEQELTDVRRRVDESRATLEAEVSRLTLDLNVAEDKLPDDFRIDYQRGVNARGEAALAPLDGQCCGGCYQTVTTQTVNEIMMSKIVICRACGCILYLPEDREKEPEQ